MKTKQKSQTKRLAEALCLPVVRHLSPVWCDAVSLYLMDGFQWSLAQMFIMEVLKVMT